MSNHVERTSRGAAWYAAVVFAVIADAVIAVVLLGAHHYFDASLFIAAPLIGAIVLVRKH